MHATAECTTVNPRELLGLPLSLSAPRIQSFIAAMASRLVIRLVKSRAPELRWRRYRISLAAQLAAARAGFWFHLAKHDALNHGVALLAFKFEDWHGRTFREIPTT